MLCALGSYSLFGNTTNCLQCPDNSHCQGGYTLISPNKGYWRANENSTNIIKCHNPDACLNNNVCSKGYIGPLCSTCDIS